MSVSPSYNTDVKVYYMIGGLVDCVRRSHKKLVSLGVNIDMNDINRIFHTKGGWKDVPKHETGEAALFWDFSFVSVNVKEIYELITGYGKPIIRSGSKPSINKYKYIFIGSERSLRERFPDLDESDEAILKEIEKIIETI